MCFREERNGLVIAARGVVDVGQLYGGEGLQRPPLKEKRGSNVFLINDVESDCSVIWLSLLLHMQLGTRQTFAG